MTFPTLTLTSDMIWRTTDLDCMVAEEIFGWRWYAYDGGHYRGVMDGGKGRDGYVEARVRAFMSPKTAKDKDWKHLNVTECTPDEIKTLPIAYSYYPPRIEHASGQHGAVAKMEAVLKKRKIHRRYCELLAEIVGCESLKTAWKLLYATCEQKCIAALSAVDSKYIQRVEDTEATP